MGPAPRCPSAHHLKIVHSMWLTGVTPWCARAHAETCDAYKTVMCHSATLESMNSRFKLSTFQPSELLETYRSHLWHAILITNLYYYWCRQHCYHHDSLLLPSPVLIIIIKIFVAFCVFCSCLEDSFSHNTERPQKMGNKLYIKILCNLNSFHATN
jgi:hypothetical protein